MIFCHITNTPALVFQNSNHKVKETYNWIKENKNIQLIENYNYESIAIAVEKLSESVQNSINLKSEYLPLLNLLK